MYFRKEPHTNVSSNTFRNHVLLLFRIHVFVTVSAYNITNGKIIPFEIQFPVLKSPLVDSFSLHRDQTPNPNGTSNFWNPESDVSLILLSLLR